MSVHNPSFITLYNHPFVAKCPNQANPKLSTLKDDDERLPIHWAAAYNHLPIVELLVARKDFDPDIAVRVILKQIKGPGLKELRIARDGRRS
jgi:ankyrin repeat protein